MCSRIPLPGPHQAVGAHTATPEALLNRIRNHGALAIALVITVLLAACGGGSKSAAPGVTKAAVAPTVGSGRATTLAQLNDPALTRIDPAELQAVFGTASQYQKDLVASGSLTLNEYQKAELADIACIQAKGFTVDPSSAKLNGLARYQIKVVGFTDLAAEQDAKGACTRMYTSAVDQVWADITVGISNTVVAESRHFMATCLAADGIQVSERPWRSTDPTVEAQYRQCSEAAANTYDTGGVGFGVEGDNAYRGS